MFSFVWQQVLKCFSLQVITREDLRRLAFSDAHFKQEKGITRFLRSLERQIVPAYFEVKMSTDWQVCNIVRLRPSQNFKDAETIIHAFITLLIICPTKKNYSLTVNPKFSCSCPYIHQKISPRHSCLTAITLAPHYLLYSV